MNSRVCVGNQKGSLSPPRVKDIGDIPNLIEAALEEINIVEFGQFYGKLTGCLQLAHT